jgi:uncharacterized protein YegP (UPF0339 family)
MRVEIIQSKHSGQWYWRFKASNGRIIADAESFPTKANAVRAAKGVVRSVLKRVTIRPTVFTAQERKDGTTYILWG